MNNSWAAAPLPAAYIYKHKCCFAGPTTLAPALRLQWRDITPSHPQDTVPGDAAPAPWAQRGAGDSQQNAVLAVEGSQAA